jgi:hypothetical protein
LPMVTSARLRTMLIRDVSFNIGLSLFSEVRGFRI